MITVSVCMIVKNEANVLRRCLDSLQGLYEELIIVDTGSTDETKEIAAEYTQQIYDFAWVDDFSAARNFAFSKATKDYIYSADADEMLDEENRNRFLDLKKYILPEVEIVQMQYLTRQEFNTTENYARDYRPKLYKRLRNFTWIDPIHESVNLTPVVFESDIEILHLPESNHGKRDFGVFQKALAKGQKLSGKLQRMYARELMLAGSEADFEDAEQNFLILALAEDGDLPEEMHTIGYIVLAHLHRLKHEDGEFFKWAMKSLCTKPCSEICMEIGNYYYEHQDFQEAMVWFVNAMQETEPVLIADSKTRQPLQRMVDYCEQLAKQDELMAEFYLEEAESYRQKLESL
ncbi:MAG: glycosyltransferase family 2 protein [Lachnospiraceae bacterium]